MFADRQHLWRQDQNHSTLEGGSRDPISQVDPSRSLGPGRSYTLHEPWIYEHLRDAAHPRGRMRRTNVNTLTVEHSWNTFLDFDLVDFRPADRHILGSIWTRPALHTRGILEVPCGDGLEELWEVDILEHNGLKKNGYHLAAARSTAQYRHADELLLMSTFGGPAHRTATGLPRTVRLWKRYSSVSSAQVIYSIPETHLMVRAWPDYSVPREELIFFTDVVSHSYEISYVGTSEGPKGEVPLATSGFWLHHGGYVVGLLSRDWAFGQSSFTAGSIVGVRLDKKGHPVLICSGHGLRKALFSHRGLRLVFTQAFANSVRTFHPNDDHP